MEYWNDGIVGFLKDIIPLLFFVKTNFAINPTFQHPKAHYSNIPEFQHSNWGEAPKFLSCLVQTDRLALAGRRARPERERRRSEFGI
jgi:hypothetical protein